MSRSIPRFDISSPTLLSEDDLHLFNEGRHFRLYEHLGAHPVIHRGTAGTYFAVWAPNADRVSVVSDANHWDPSAAPLSQRGSSGLWEGFVPAIGDGSLYKYDIVSRHAAYRVQKADPFAFHAETSPRTASVVTDIGYEWNDAEWMQQRSARQTLAAPISIYEVHLGSWMRVPEEGNRFLGYRELASRLAEYVIDLGFTHVELLPVMEHPFYASWGYQSTGYFAPTSRYGTPQDFMYFIDHLHKRGIGVILDWVPSHFPTDEHGLGYFDGTHLFEHADARKGLHPDWKSLIFNYGRNEVRSFLVSSALFWLDRYHADGLRVDAVASMLYLDYSRRTDEWIPNESGGRENTDAIRFLHALNEEIYRSFPDVQTIAEESTAWPMVSRPVYAGGLGFGFKWDMGWMHDRLEYFQKDPIHRSHHHSSLTFRMLYANSENFLLPLSHDEVVHEKGSLLNKMSGDEWQRFANLRLLFGALFLEPGKKLLFMGGEFGQQREWDHDSSLDWHLLRQPQHGGLRGWVRDLNAAYRTENALHEYDCNPEGFEWIDCEDSAQSIVAFLRRGGAAGDAILVVMNFTPIPRHVYRIGAPRGGFWREILNSDASEYGGSGLGNLGGVHAMAEPCHGRPFALDLLLPPLAVVALKGAPS